jgi:glutamine---fructose-6-phosphate transaminase (isomerizing)
MNLEKTKYSDFALCKEMMETVQIVRTFDPQITENFVPALDSINKVLITGEGSSRIFPAKHFIYQSLLHGVDYGIITEGARQALEYPLHDFVVFGVSNSGKTREVVRLFSHLKDINHKANFGLTATMGSPLANYASKSVILSCGKEMAVAATKSVIEEALFFHSLLYSFINLPMPNLLALANQIDSSLQLEINPEIISLFCKAPIIYYSGRNDGVAEELTLKTNEITRKKSVFLEGTYALHGIEEVMNPGELMVIIEPFEEEEQKFQEVLVEGAGINIIAIATRDTCFPTIRIPDGGELKSYIELVMGWNLLVEAGLHLGFDIDTPIRARKIGNEETVN